MLPSGQPVVSNYSFLLYAGGSLDPYVQIDLGKRAPQSGGLIRVDFSGRIPVAASEHDVRGTNRRQGSQRGHGEQRVEPFRAFLHVHGLERYDRLRFERRHVDGACRRDLQLRMERVELGELDRREFVRNGRSCGTGS